MTAGTTPRISLADNTIDREEIEAVTAVLASRWLSAGSVTRAFEQEFAAALGAPDAVAVSSGTAALHLAVLALDLRPGDEVIVPSLSFVASAAVVALHGGVPVFADVCGAHEPTVDPADVRRLMSERTRAIVAMHYGGYPARIATLAAVAREHGVALIEDAAHAPIVRAGGQMLGRYGDIGCFSFHAAKNITTGEGGMVVASDPDVLRRIRSLRSHCMIRTGYGYDVPAIGVNYRPTEISSAIGRVQLARLSEDRRRRHRLVSRYARGLAGVAGVDVLSRPVSDDSAYHLMVVLLPPGVRRDAVQAALDAVGVQTSMHYPPTHLLSGYHRDRAGWRRAAADRERLPVTEAVAGRLISLPLHSRMSDADVDTVVDALAGVPHRAGEE